MITAATSFVRSPPRHSVAPRAHRRHRDPAWFAAFAALLTWSMAAATAEDTGDWCFVGCRGDEFECQQYPPRPIAADSELAQSPIAGIYTGCRQGALSYRFAVPDGTYHVRLHYLKAAGGPTKNNAGFSASVNGTTLVTRAPMWVPLRNFAVQLPKEIPADLVAKVQETDVDTKDGHITVAFPHAFDAPYWGISGIEIVGATRSVRVRCGAEEPYTDAAGNIWEPDTKHRQPIPDSGEFTIDEIDHATKRKWVDVSRAFFTGMERQLALGPLPRQGALSWRVICDHRGDVYFAVSGIGCWRYDWTAGKAWRVDQGWFSGDPMYGLSVNPAGPGIYLMGLYGLQQGFSSIRTLDGEHFERISPNDPKAFAHGGTDQISVDWTADPHVVIGVIHDYQGQTCASSDGGMNFRRFDDGKNPELAGIGAIGGGVLLKCQKDGSLTRSADVGGTWTNAGKLAFSTPAACVIQRLGDTVFLHTGAGDLFLSTDLGVTWSSGPSTPGFHSPILRGRGDQQLIGFTADKAYESVDFGRTWTMAVERGPARRGDHFQSGAWSYDQALDAFYHVTGSGDILRYAR
jgi:hypothetical protein